MHFDSSRPIRQPPILVSRRGESDPPRIDDLERFAQWMESVFEIPGTGIRFGFDAIVGLLPGIGDTITAFLSLYILAAASRYGVPRVTLLRMALNVGIDALAGCVPFLGDLFDVAWKANSRNVALLKKHVAATPDEARRARRGDWLVVLGTGLALLAIVSLALFIAYWFFVLVGRAIRAV